MLRLLSLSALLWSGVFALHVSTPADRPLARQPLADFPSQVDGWSAIGDDPFAEDVVKVLGVDDFVNRWYADPAHDVVVSLFAGYYGTQRHGDTIHSPLNCLPGSGWQPEAVSEATLASPAGDVRVRRLLVRRGLERYAVLYWYQGRGRVTADDYQAKALLVWDALVRGRDDGGLVRVMLPAQGTATDAFEHAVRFATSALPRLSAHYPN